MSKIYTFNPQIYPRKLFLIIDGKYNPDDDFCFPDSSPIGIDNYIALTFPSIKKSDSGELGVLIVLKNKQTKQSDIAHECVHAAMSIFNDLGINIDTDNQEAFAYMVGWCVKSINSVLKGRRQTALLPITE